MGQGPFSEMELLGSTSDEAGRGISFWPAPRLKGKGRTNLRPALGKRSDNLNDFCGGEKDAGRRRARRRSEGRRDFAF